MRRSALLLPLCFLLPTGPAFAKGPTTAAPGDPAAIATATKWAKSLTAIDPKAASTTAILSSDAYRLVSLAPRGFRHAAPAPATKLTGGCAGEKKGDTVTVVEDPRSNEISLTGALVCVVAAGGKYFDDADWNVVTVKDVPSQLRKQAKALTKLDSHVKLVIGYAMHDDMDASLLVATLTIGGDTFVIGAAQSHTEAEPVE